MDLKGVRRRRGRVGEDYAKEEGKSHLSLGEGFTQEGFSSFNFMEGEGTKIHLSFSKSNQINDSESSRREESSRKRVGKKKKKRKRKREK